MDIESEVGNKRIDCSVIINGEEETFIIYVEETDSNKEILELAHEIALYKFGGYDELSFEEGDA